MRLGEPTAIGPDVPESVVQEIWRLQRFDRRDLRTVGGGRLVVLDPGTLNRGPGPDFVNARILLDRVEWRGCVEVHRSSKGWVDHGHGADPVYNSVVLHLTFRADAMTGRLRRHDGSLIPELVLLPLLRQDLRPLLAPRSRLLAGRTPCHASWNSVPVEIRKELLRDCAEAGLAAKGRRAALELSDTPRPADALHRLLFRGLGYAGNEAPMEQLARLVPLERAFRFENRSTLELYLIGAAGLLSSESPSLFDAGGATAPERFRRLLRRYPLRPMHHSAWRLHAQRPANHPRLRILQGCGWLVSGGLLRERPEVRLLEALRHPRPIADLRRLLTPVPPPDSERRPRLGKQRQNRLLQDLVLPFLWHTGAADVQDRIREILRALPVSSDRILRTYHAMGAACTSAYEAIGYHRLYRSGCTTGGCLGCPVGRYILQRPGPRSS